MKWDACVCLSIRWRARSWPEARTFKYFKTRLVTSGVVWFSHCGVSVCHHPGVLRTLTGAVSRQGAAEPPVARYPCLERAGYLSFGICFHSYALIHPLPLTSLESSLIGLPHCLPIFITSLGVSSWKLNSSCFSFHSEFGTRDFPLFACNFSSSFNKFGCRSSHLRWSFLSWSLKTQTSFISSLFRSCTFPLF